MAGFHIVWRQHTYNTNTKQPLTQDWTNWQKPSAAIKQDAVQRHFTTTQVKDNCEWLRLTGDPTQEGGEGGSSATLAYLRNILAAAVPIPPSIHLSTFPSRYSTPNSLERLSWQSTPTWTLAASGLTLWTTDPHHQLQTLLIELHLCMKDMPNEDKFMTPLTDTETHRQPEAQT